MTKIRARNPVTEDRQKASDKNFKIIITNTIKAFSII